MQNFALAYSTNVSELCKDILEEILNAHKQIWREWDSNWLLIKPLDSSEGFCFDKECFRQRLTKVWNEKNSPYPENKKSAAFPL